MTERAECLQTGQKAQFTKKLTEEDVMNFAEASGDMNPVHLDDARVKKAYLASVLFTEFW